MCNVLHKSIYKDDTGELFLEIAEIGPVIHCYSYKWSKGVYRHYWEVWVEFLHQMKDRGFPVIYAAVDNEKLYNFALMFGFKPENKVITDNTGKIRNLMACSLK